MNWVDLMIILLFLFFTFDVFRHNLIMETLDFLSFLLAFFISFGFYNLPAKMLEVQFSVPHAISLVLGFMSMWFLSEFLFFIFVRIIYPKIPVLKSKSLNLLSIVPAFFKGLVFISLILVMVATFPVQPWIKKGVLDSKIGSQILKKAYALESPVKAVFGGVTNESLTFLTIKPATNEKIDLGFTTNQLEEDKLTEVEMIELVNKERDERGLKKLIYSEKLRDVAIGHSKDMFIRGYFAHLSPEGKSVADRADEKDVDFLAIGENLAYAPNLEAAHKGLMNSKGHRENILSEDYAQIGIGVIDGGIYGKMFTQVFTN